MGNTSGNSNDMPDPESLSGKKFDTSAAFGGGAALAKDTTTQMQESGIPAGGEAAGAPAPDSSGSGPDETLQQILKGEVPKSGSR